MLTGKRRRKTDKTVEEIIDSLCCPVSETDKQKRKESNADIAIYNRSSSMYGNPFSGDTTVLDRSVDNRCDPPPQTVEEIIDSVLHPKHVIRLRNNRKLSPEMVSPEVKDYFRQKITGSALSSARAYKKMTDTPRLITQEDI